MVDRLKAGKLLQGYRGAPPIDMEALIALMTAFSGLLMKLADQVTSIDLNPVFCSAAGCVVADARIPFALELPQAWLDENPLTAAALESEADYWKAVGMKLTVSGLSEKKVAVLRRP